MRILVTGCTGFLGTNLVEYLAKNGEFKIIGTDIPNADFSEVKKFCSRIIPCDLTSDSLKELFENGIDVVVHTAAIFDFSAPHALIRRVNVDAVERICRASFGKVSLFIHISSTGVYGKPQKIPADEETPQKPRNIYEKTKCESEKIVSIYEKKGLNTVILRPTLMYGPRSKYGYAMLIGLFSLAREKGLKKLPSITSGPMTHSVYIEDVCEAILTVIRNPKNGKRIFNVADESPIPFDKMLEIIAESVGVKLEKKIPYHVAKIITGTIIKLPIYRKLKEDALKAWEELVREKNLKPVLKPRLDEDWNHYFQGNFVYSTERIKSLGFKSKYNFEEGIEKTVRWYRENRWIP